MITSSNAETEWLAAMCTEAATAVVEQAIEQTASIDSFSADRLRLVVQSRLHGALCDVVEKVAQPAIALQPIVHVEGGTVIGYEALARFGGGAGAHDTFRRAAERGLHVEVELVTLTEALKRLPDVPAGAFLGVNISGEALIDRRVLDVLADADTSRVVIELTQQVQIGDIAELKATFRELQAIGAVICLDQAGVGFLTAQRMLELEPEMIKIARSLVSGCDEDLDKQQQVRNLVSQARRIGAVSVAIGVERESELTVLQRLGVDAVQGHLLGHPEVGEVPTIALGHLALSS